MSFLLVSCFAFLWRLGGMDRGRPGAWGSSGWGGWRDTVLPAAIGISFFWVYGWIGALVGITSLVIRMGDGNYSPDDDDKPSFLGRITRDRSGVWTKGLHGLICGLVAPLPLLWLGMSPLWYLLWAVGFGVVSGALRCLDDVWVEECTRGAWFSMIMFLI